MVEDQFAGLSEMARQIVRLARKEAAFFQHEEVRPEHVLLAISAVPECVASRVLRRQQIDAQQVVRETVGHFRIGRAGPNVDAESLALSPAVLELVQAARDEARRLGSEYAGTEYLLLALLRDEGGLAARVLRQLGLDTDQLRRDTAGLASGERRSVAGTSSHSARRSGQVTPTPTIALGQQLQDYTPASPFFRFTERARQALAFAEEEARRFNHSYIGTEHLLLGLVRDEESIAAKVLANLGVTRDRVSDRVAQIIGRGPQPPAGPISLTPRAGRMIELAGYEARRLGHDYAGTEHMLLALVCTGEGIAAGVLEGLGVNVDDVCAQVRRMLGNEQ